MSDYKISKYDVTKTILILSIFIITIWSATFLPLPAVQPIDNYPVINGIIGETEYNSKITVKGIEVYWFNDDSDLYMGIKSPGLGWVAVAFDPIDMHIGANYIFGSVTGNETIVSDQFSVEQYWHAPDVSLGGTEDILEYAGNEGDGTVIEFHIKLDSGDAYDKVLVPGESVKILVAYNLSIDDFKVKHSDKAVSTIMLYKENKPTE